MPHTVMTRRPVDPLAVMDRNRTLLTEAECYAYKTVGEQDLEAYVFQGKGEAPPEGRPVTLFFFSSGWDNGLVSQFAPHCLYLANRGMTSVLIDYRVHSRFPGATPLDAMADARSAVRWVRENAAELGVNPAKVVAAGGAAGAHAALAAALLNDFDAPEDNISISCAPDALVLFSPVLDLSRKGVGRDRFPDKRTARRSDLMRAVRRRMPPVIILHGTADRVVPFENSVRFRKKNWWRRNPCRLKSYEGSGHGFFNFNVDPRLYELTLSEVDSFLVEFKFLSPLPEEETGTRLASDGRFRRVD